MQKIILHWTAGAPLPCAEDLQHYHFLVNKDGLRISGIYAPEDNLNCADGKYARHCGGGNTGSIGVAMCGMYVPKGKTLADTPYPLTLKQTEATFKLCAELCKKYKIKISPTTVLTHAEFGAAHPNTSSRGKIDIICLPPYPEIPEYQIGNFIRNKILWYFLRL